ncbi:hypothetical protein niasHT_018104 [Heterodera trifolii]|uniref:C2H2-type domain-containing protein n=1 Tax=Heterodera trifolii TaxID=157864 RepID=A0ABD2KXY6_9BILA
MHDPSNSTAQSDPNIDLSVGSAQNRTEQGDESGELGEEDVAHQYVLGVPIALPLPCRFCAGRSFNTHAGLSKHLKKDHTPQNTWHLAFRCHGCRQIFAQLRVCNAHQKKSAQCQGAQPIQEERHQPLRLNLRNDPYRGQRD